MARLIHRMWLGPRPMPPLYRDFGEQWAALNPEWEVLDWSWHNLPSDLDNWQVVEDLIGRCTRNPVGLATQAADVIAYELVYRYGGAYFNADIEPLRPLDQLVDEYVLSGQAWAGMEDGTYLVNAAFGGPAEHPSWRAVIEELPRRYRAMLGAEMNQSTGPRLLTALWEMDRSKFIALPSHVFNPVHWSAISLGSERADTAGLDLQRSYGVHHWGHRRVPRSNIVD